MELIQPVVIQQQQSCPGFWQKRLILPLRNQLTQGESPRALTWAVIVALGAGIFPILGTTTLVSFLFGLIFRLNQTVIQSVNFLCYPLHIALILPFIRMGERLLGVEPIEFSIPKMLDLFMERPATFFESYGMTCVHCISAWILTAPFIVGVLYPVISPLVKKLRPVSMK